MSHDNDIHCRKIIRLVDIEILTLTAYSPLLLLPTSKRNDCLGVNGLCCVYVGNIRLLLIAFRV